MPLGCYPKRGWIYAYKVKSKESTSASVEIMNLLEPKACSDKFYDSMVIISIILNAFRIPSNQKYTTTKYKWDIFPQMS